MKFCQVASPIVSSILLVMPSSTSAERCMKDQAVSKTCPDFLDEPDEIYCCPSKTVVGSFFCCSSELRDSLLFKNGHSSTDIPTVIGGSIAGACAFLLLIFLMCYYCNCCLLYKLRHKRKRQDASMLKDGTTWSCQNEQQGVPHTRYPVRMAMYQRVTTSETQQTHKEPHFEAPPPYDLADMYAKEPPLYPASSPSNSQTYVQQNDDNELRCNTTLPSIHPPPP